MCVLCDRPELNDDNQRMSIAAAIHNANPIAKNTKSDIANDPTCELLPLQYLPEVLTFFDNDDKLNLFFLF
jgi:hypothetical protein